MEEEEDIARCVEANLSHAGFEVAVALNGHAGLERLHLDGFDEVICGFMMPGLLGDEVVRRLRADARSGALPVVVPTAQTDTARVMSAMEAGADDCV